MFSLFIFLFLFLFLCLSICLSLCVYVCLFDHSKAIGMQNDQINIIWSVYIKFHYECNVLGNMCVEKNRNKILPLVWLCIGCMDGCGLVRWLPGTRFAWSFLSLSQCCFLVCMHLAFQLKLNISWLMECAHLPHFRISFYSLSLPLTCSFPLPWTLAVWPPWIIPQNFRIEAVNLLGEPSTLRSDLASSKSLKAMRPHFMSLYYRLSRQHRTGFQFILCMHSVFVCVSVSSFVFIQA